jgi:Fe-S-cluster containining protein
MNDLASSWLDAARDPTIRAELEAVYERVASATRERRPLCTASGRCCHFEKHGHRLYVTGLEAAYTIASLQVDGARGVLHDPSTREAGDVRAAPTSPRVLSLPQVDAARERGDCPFLVDNLCSVQGIKPLGCRVYYCDPTAQQWQMELSEECLSEIRAIHDRHGIEYRYGEWRGMLANMVHA